MRARTLVAAATCLVVALGRSLAAQAPAELSGRVVDARTSAALGDASVAFADQVVRTGPDGRFRLTILRSGSERLVTRAVGYLPDTLTVAVTPGIGQDLLVSLRRAALTVAPLTATATPAGAEVLTADEVRARGPDLATALDGWAGVSVRRSGAMGAVAQVRGSAPEEVLVLVDGVPLNDPLTGRADLSRIPSSEVRRVVLEPGAQTARAGGRALAGVIDVVTRAPASIEAATGFGSYGARSLRAGAGVAGLGTGGSWQRLPDDYPARNRDGSPGIRTNAGGTAWDAYLRHQGGLSYSARVAGSDRGLPGNITNPSATGRASDRSVVVSAGMPGAVHWDASAEWLETRAWDPDAPPLGTSYDVTTRSAGGGASVGVRQPVSAGGWSGTADLSADGRYDRFSGDAVASGAEFGRAGARLSADLARGPWSVSPVVRADGWSGLGAPIVTGRMDVDWQGEGTVLSVGVGSGVAPPVPFDLLFRDGVGVAVNPGLRPERVRWELSGEVRRTGRIGGIRAVASVRGFVGRVDDLVLWAAGPNFVWSPHNVDVRRRGGEVQLELRPLPTLTVSSSATASFINYANATAYPVAYRPRDTERLSATWSPAGWRLNLAWRRLGPRPQANNGQFNLPAIDLLDAGVERAIGRSFLLRLDATDLGDRRPEYIAGLPLPGRSIALTLSYGGN